MGLAGWDNLAASWDNGTEDDSEDVTRSTDDEDIDTMEAADGDNMEGILDETSKLGGAAADEIETDETAAMAEHDITINTTTKLRNQPREKLLQNFYISTKIDLSSSFSSWLKNILGARCAFKVEQTAEDDKMSCAMQQFSFNLLSEAATSIVALKISSSVQKCSVYLLSEIYTHVTIFIIHQWCSVTLTCPSRKSLFMQNYVSDP